MDCTKTNHLRINVVPMLSGDILFLPSDLKPHNLYEGNNFCSIIFPSSGF